MKLNEREDMMAASAVHTTTATLVSFACFAMLTTVAKGIELKTYIMPGETCGYTVTNGDQFKVVSHQLQDNQEPSMISYMANVSCTIIFRTEPHKRNFLRLYNFEIESSKFCSKDGLYQYDGGNEDTDQLLSANRHALCGTTLSLPNYFVSSGPEVMVKFVTDGSDNSYNGFTVLITPFTETDNCDGFRCHLSRRCITKDAACNKEYQCEDGSDEPPNCHLQNAGISTTTSCHGRALATICATLWIYLIKRAVLIP